MSIFTSKLRSLVSQDRIRLEETGLNIDLDLTYVTNRVVAMSFPATGFEAAWRNDIQDVCQLLRTKHKNHFLVFNLSERDYAYDLLDNQIVCFPFKDHHAPPLYIIFQIINNMDSWLKAADEHVAIVHCIGGKGRTGLIIVCYLFYSCLYPDIERCLSFFAERRSAKGKGVTQPSQLRYVKYFCDLVSGKQPINLNQLQVMTASVGPVPKGLYVFLEVYPQLYTEILTEDEESQENLIFSTYLSPDSRVFADDGRIVTEINKGLSGDILVKGFVLGAKDAYKNKAKLFRLQFHTGLEKRGDVEFTKTELDDINKDKKKFPADFGLRFHFSDLDVGRRATMAAYSLIFHQMQTTYTDTLAHTPTPPSPHAEPTPTPTLPLPIAPPTPSVAIPISSPSSLSSSSSTNSNSSSSATSTPSASALDVSSSSLPVSASSSLSLLMASSVPSAPHSALSLSLLPHSSTITSTTTASPSPVQMWRTPISPPGSPRSSRMRSTVSDHTFLPTRAINMRHRDTSFMPLSASTDASMPRHHRSIRAPLPVVVADFSVLSRSMPQGLPDRPAMMRSESLQWDRTQERPPDIVKRSESMQWQSVNRMDGRKNRESVAGIHKQLSFSPPATSLQLDDIYVPDLDKFNSLGHRPSSFFRKASRTRTNSNPLPDQTQTVEPPDDDESPVTDDGGRGSL